MTVVTIQRVIDGVPTSADSATLQITNYAGSVMLATTPVVPASAGVYTYSTVTFPPGNYTAVWTFIVAGQQNDVLTRYFVVDPPMEIFEGFRLMDLEQAVARRIGPYKRVKVASAVTSSVVMPKLQSSIDTGEYEEQYILRRGLMWDGSWVSNFDTDDRQRQIATFTATAGLAEVDRVWTEEPVENEALELHYLNPEEELRYAVLEGLRNCYFWDTVDISSTGRLTDFDVTTSVPWITRPGQIGGVEHMYTNQVSTPSRMLWYKPYMVGNRVHLSTGQLVSGSIRITALRPVFTYVNGEMNMAGPNDDQDILYCDREYAILSAHRSAWMNYPDLLQPIAVQNMRPSREDVAAAYTIRSYAMAACAPEYVMNKFENYTDLGVVGNLPEPVN